MVSACSIARRRSNKSIVDDGFSALARLDFAIGHLLLRTLRLMIAGLDSVQKVVPLGKTLSCEVDLGADQQL